MNTYQQLDAWVDAHFDQQVTFLQQLIRVPTDTPPGNNAPHAERTAELLQAFGFTAEKHAVPAADVQAAGLESITNDDTDLCVRAFQNLLEQLAMEFR